MIIKEEDIAYLRGQQELLDNEIRKEKGIDEDAWRSMNVEHMTALAVEVGEFVNETKVFKYWSEKEVNKSRMLDEAVDVIHFVLLVANKLNLESTKFTIDEGEFYKLTEFKQAQNIAHQLLNGVLSEALSNTFFRVLMILDYFELTWEDVMDQYDTKNAVNFKRLESGY